MYNSTEATSGRLRSRQVHIVRHAPEFEAAVEAFNARMRAAGSPWGFYVTSECPWLPEVPGRQVWRELYLVMEDDGTVRGGYVLKPQPWLVRGQMRTVTDWQGPFSEGSINPQFGPISLRMMRDMMKRRPLLYSWGHGADNTPLVQMLTKLKWLHHSTPLCVYVIHPARFLRSNRLLRGTRRRRLAMDALAHSGAGSMGLKALHAALGLRARRRMACGPQVSIDTEVVSEFGDWTDAVWERSKSHYTALAVRDAGLMNTLLPREGWPKAIRLRMRRNGQTLGWAAVLDTQMENDARFGNSRVGSIIDCFGLPQDAPLIVREAKRFLRECGVDVIVSNQSHPAWLRAFEYNGFFLAMNRRSFVAAPPMQAVLGPFEQTKSGLHLTNMDGHGPHLL